MFWTGATFEIPKSIINFVGRRFAAGGSEDYVRSGRETVVNAQAYIAMKVRADPQIAVCHATLADLTAFLLKKGVLGVQAAEVATLISSTPLPDVMSGSSASSG